MSPTFLLSAGKLLVSNRKAQLAFVGLQFAYITYKIIQEKSDQPVRSSNKLKHKKAMNS